MTQFDVVLKRLVEEKIKFILVGGLAAVFYGSSYQTNDLDICYQRKPENIKKIVKFLRSVGAKLRGVPENLPFQLDEKSISFGMNFTFKTSLGDLDFLGELPGLDGYDQLMRAAEPSDLYGMKIYVISLNELIQAKRTAGRPKDLMHLKELEAIQAMKEKSRD